MENEKVKKPFFKKVWFWVVVVIIIAIVAVSSGGEDPANENEIASQSNTSQSNVEETVTYEQVELQTMLDDLKNNALKAEKTYMNKNVEITGKISNFDSDGNYISIEPVNADEWNFETVTCNVKDDNQLNLLLEKSVGDTITISGKITSVGEVLGYTLNIDEIK